MNLADSLRAVFGGVFALLVVVGAILRACARPAPAITLD